MLEGLMATTEDEEEFPGYTEWVHITPEGGEQV